MKNDEFAACPDADLLAAFAEGKLPRHEQPPIVAHVSDCVRCMAAIEAVSESLPRAANVVPFALRRGYLPIAAIVVAALIAIPVMREVAQRRSPVARLIALAPRNERRVEPRLSGGFAWAEYGGAERATESTADANRLKLAGEAGELVEQAQQNPGAATQHAAGVAMLLIEAPADAVPRLEAAARGSNDAKVWSDLAAARYAAASKLGQASQYPMALAAADAALRIDPKLAEALFNRALILERLGLTEEARRAWQKYLEADPSSPWANEARARLAALPASTSSSQFERERPLLERAGERGDAAALRTYVDRYRDRARALAEGQYLAEWAEALQRGDDAEAARWLRMTRAIGAALFDVSGEAMPRDAVAAIDRASEADRRTIAAAHLLYREARIAYSRDVREGVDGDLLRAAAEFEAANDPMALMARYYAASVRLARNDTAGARADLERQRAVADAHPGYITHGAQVRWELGRARMLDYDWQGAADAFRDGAAMFRRAGVRGSEAFVEILLAHALGSLGRDDDAWQARARAFDALSAEGESAVAQLAASVGSAVHDELQRGHHESALALSGVEITVARRAAKPQMLVDALADRALLESNGGDAAGALEAAREADGVARSTADSALRERILAVADTAMGAALAMKDPVAALQPLTRAIDFYTAHDLAAALPEPLLLRSHCAARAGDANAAMRDLERGMSIVDRHGLAGGGAGVLDAEHALFTDAIRVALDRGDEAAAFGFAERSRGSAVTVAQLQQLLAGSDAAVLEIVSLPHEIVTFAITSNDAVTARRPLESEKLASLAGESLSETGNAAASALYDDLIRPTESILGGVHELVIVGDPHLQTVPFAALYDRIGQRHLIERFAVSVAASAGSLQRDSVRVAVPALAAVVLPSGGANAAGLPEADSEVSEIASLYARSEAIRGHDATLAALTAAAPAANVIHIAGHTERQPGGGEQALLFADSPVSWRTIVARPPVKRGVVVLAACETLRPPASAATRALSLGGAFSAAGADDVIGTLAPVGDRDARTLFTALHRRLAAGARPAVALREAMLEAIASDKTNGGRRAWRAVALLTRRTPAPQPRGR